MNAGISLSELAKEVERQNTAKRDYIAPLGRLRADLSYPEGEGPNTGAVAPVMVLSNGDAHAMPIRRTAHQQIAEEVGIPKGYYDRMLTEFPELWRANVNHIIEHGKGEREKRKMVRTMDGELRALLSDRYRPLDNFDLLEVVLPILQRQTVKVVSSNITESRMYLKVILPNIQAEVQGVTLGVGHNHLQKNILVAALTISNSEVGSGSLQVVPSVFDTWCTNLAQLSVKFMRKYHIGRTGTGDGDSVEELLSNDTRQVRDKAFWMSVRDVVKNSLNDEAFKMAVAGINQAASDKIESRDLPAVIEVATELLGLDKSVRGNLLTSLVQRGDLSRWGLASAVTAQANADGMDYESSNDFERLGGQVIELGKHEWARITSAGRN